MFKIARMNRKRAIFFVSLPVILLTGWIYPYLPWHNLGLCAIKRMIGINCPGCGFVRSVFALVNGNVRESIDYNPMGIVAFILLGVLWLSQFVIKPLFKKDFRPSSHVMYVVSLSFVAALFINWFFYLLINFRV